MFDPNGAKIHVKICFGNQRRTPAIAFSKSKQPNIPGKKKSNDKLF
jgi:hypothetical protein